MKYRLAALIIFFSLVLTSCSLAEDITPPPGYQSPTSVPTLAQASQTPQPASTREHATPTAITDTPAVTQSTSLTADISATPGTSLGNITGDLVNASGGGIPEGQKVTLVGYDKDQSGSYQKVMQVEEAVNADGSYHFKGVEVPLGRAFLLVTSLEGVEFQSAPLLISTETTDYSLPIIIYDKTDNLDILTFSQVHVIFGLPSQNSIQVTELFVVANPGKQVVLVPSDGTTIPFIHIPETASGLKYQLSQSSAELINVTGGFGLLPGTDKQYGFVANFSMPYTKNLEFDQAFSLPVSSLTVFVPQGMRLRSELVTEAGLQTMQSQIFQLYQATTMAAGSSLSLKISGHPGDTSGFKLDRQTIVIIGISVVGLFLVGAGISLYLYDRARFKKENGENEENEEKTEKDSLGEDRDNIMDAIIALDDQYKAGEIPQKAYEERRIGLKDRLKESL
jgi:hypothetical protein